MHVWLRAGETLYCSNNQGVEYCDKNLLQKRREEAHLKDRCYLEQAGGACENYKKCVRNCT